MSMTFEVYLAMTAAEMAAAPALPEHIGYMACHFSPYTTGLSNLPEGLPKDSMLILNDRTPPRGHDPKHILRQLEQAVERLECGCVLLDFQRPGCEETAEITKSLLGLPCPIGVSELYAQALDCPVFLPPVPLDVTVREHLAPWEGREIWLEAALDSLAVTVGATGTAFHSALSGQPSLPHRHEALCCHYGVSLTESQAVFTLRRTAEDLKTVLEMAKQYGVSKAVGLYQELGQQSLNV